VRSLLNKLTQERFESLASQILALPLSTPEQLNVIAAEIFEKATSQKGFRSLYTELCMRLDKHLAEQDSAVGGKAFRKALVAECQATFERNLKPVDAAAFASLPEDERQEAELKLKIFRLGNMSFIGELLVRRLLAPKLMLSIIHELISGNSEAMLESLIALLTVVGPCFDQKASIYQAPLKETFAKLRNIKYAEGNDLSSSLPNQRLAGRT
jgi:translation initiation factor 4G